MLEHQEYIITGEQLNLIAMYAKWSDTHMLALEAIRSRPHSPDCEYHYSTNIDSKRICHHPQSKYKKCGVAMRNRECPKGKEEAV